MSERATETQAQWWANWERNWAAMMADAPFIAWLGKYDPHWEDTYSGDLLALHDAWVAGRSSLSSPVEASQT